ncbi:ECF transporter S component [Lysinibacillus yapensis]|uniref:ECF transporter S component n=1 Tax=Ureibacillus yapensis TaxID=2304605 RepID=A0A396SBY0_9BACL|nr:ECF transporter S component [Lysinibacillus yapensis]RHW38540.1 ECF transporter S component [Lysinibacillus yapensis]
MESRKLKVLILTALIAAICVIGSFIKVPGFLATSALDSAPAFISVAFLPPVYSGLAGALGHLATSMLSGFPLGSFHFIIAAEMFIIVYLFNVLHRKSYNIIKWIFLIVSNGIGSALPFYFLISPAFFFSAVPSLLIATIINAVVAIIVLPAITRVFKREEVCNE